MIARRRAGTGRRSETGATAVEFALVAAMFIFLMLGITDLGRWFFLANSASEAARLGARLAVVCDPASWNTGVLRQMQVFVADLQPANVTFQRFPSDGCDTYGSNPSTVCTGVSVTVSDLEMHPFSPYFPSIPIPPFKVTLPRESMLSSVPEASGGPSTNTVCN